MLLREGEVERTLRKKDLQRQQALAEQERQCEIATEYDRLRRRLAGLEREKDIPQRGS